VSDSEMGWVEARTARQLRKLVFLTGIGIPCARAEQAFRQRNLPSISTLDVSGEPR